MTQKPSTKESFKAVFTSWRLGSVTVMSLSSGIPLGLVWTAVPAWMAMTGVDIKTIGVLTLAQTPYAFKFMWAPLLDRYALPPGRKRGWIALLQLILAACLGFLAYSAATPEVAVVAVLTVLIAFASATQDIAIDAYAVDALEKNEQGLAVGARTALYRVGMWLAGNIAISLGDVWGWRVTLVCLAAIFVALVPATLLAPEPVAQAPAPVSLRAAVWEPFVGFFKKTRALEITAFLLLYKLADNLAGALVRPFLVQMGFDPVDVGIASGTIGLFGTMGGTFVGGLLTTRMGVGRALWMFGFLQAISNVGYAVVASTGSERLVMYGAMGVESFTSGLGTGAFFVLLMRLTEKRFSATQYALFSSIFALGRTVVGPIAGVLVDALGWRDFFYLTIFCAAPGLWMLQRFVPWGMRELPEFADDDTTSSKFAPITRTELTGSAVLGVALGAALALGTNAVLAALKLLRAGEGFDVWAAMLSMLQPASIGSASDLLGSVIFGLLFGVATTAYLLAKRGLVKS